MCFKGNGESRSEGLETKNPANERNKDPIPSKTPKYCAALWIFP